MKELALKIVSEKKKYIGNSVEKNVGVAFFKAVDKVIQNPTDYYIPHNNSPGQLTMF